MTLSAGSHFMQHAVMNVRPSPNPIASNRSHQPPPRWPELTTRETVVLMALVTGDSNKEIARRLGIGEQTVKNHVSVVIQKFQVRNRVQLAVLVAFEMPQLFHQVE